MKKTLIALSLAGAVAAAGAASAAEVQVYGLVDLSLAYVHSDADAPGVDSTDKFTMENAREFGSRFGIKGMEDLGNGYKVGFVLENGFKADDGSLDQGGDLFGREAHLDLYSPYGTLTFGVMPVFGSTLGANGLFRAIDPLFANYTEGFGSGLITASSWTRVDNAISYVTPTFAGFTGYAMYSFKNNGGDYGDEGKASTDRYASLALRYQGGAFEGVIVADATMYGQDRAKAPGNTTVKSIDDNGYTVTIGGNYTFDNGLKLLAFGQWFDGMELSRTKGKAGVIASGLQNFDGLNDYGVVSGYGLSLGANYPLGGGVIKGQIGYRDMDNNDDENATVDADFSKWMVAVGYDYPLSKRTAVYVMGGYSQEKIETKTEDRTPSGCELVAGMVHRF